MRQGLAAIVLALVLSGCSSAFFSDQDIRIEAADDTLYIFARSDWVSRNVCTTLSGYAPVVEARWAPFEGRQLQTGQVYGCHMIRRVIVCDEGNPKCLQRLGRHSRPATRPGHLQTEPLQ
jgi:hypothetical protein